MRRTADLLELRLDEGPMSEDDARAALLAWWAAQGCLPHPYGGTRPERGASSVSGMGEPPGVRQVVVMGVSGVGKTTVAKGISTILGWTFAEGDASPTPRPTSPRWPPASR